ncbi:MAG: S9 family peptidase [Bacteroidetes bacterium]|nr:S9 family peptidase [Bacteroidota bacterium]
MKRILIFMAAASVFCSLPAQKTAFTTADVLNVVTFSVQDVTDDGLLIAGSTYTRKDRMNVDHMRYGDPSYVSPSYSRLVILNTTTGVQTPVLPEPAIVSAVRWSPDGKSLAFLRYEEGKFRLYVYDQAKNRVRRLNLKTDREIASGSSIIWMPDGKGVILSFRDYGWKAEGDSMYREATAGPITVYDGSRPFLKWDEIRNHPGLVMTGLIDIDALTVRMLLGEGRNGSLRLSADGQFVSYVITYPKKTAYDNRGGADYEMKFIEVAAPDSAMVLIKKSEQRVAVTWNRDNNVYAWVDSAKVFIRGLEWEKPRRVGRDTTEVNGKDTVKVRLSVNRWSRDGSKILASSAGGYWVLDIETDAMTDIYRFPENRDKEPALSVIEWSPDGRYLYMTTSARDKWERGLLRYDIASKNFTGIVKDSNLYSGWRLTEDGTRWLYEISDGDLPSDLYMAGNDLSHPKRLTNSNPWLGDRTISKSQLMKYRDSDGRELWGVLYYPVDYEPGRKYPLVCEIYEGFFSNGYSFSMQLLANAGYFAFKPSVNLIQGYPGEAWIKGITSGINKLIDEGLVDEKKLGVHGTSYGGYATSLLITQTDRFAAAINISGKVNIISFLGDSPKIGTRNYSAAENGQDRIGQTLWEAPMKYFATSAVLYADRIKTPHLLLTGEGDWNVPATNTRELYYAMRRLGKEVVWVNYVNGGHGAGAASNESDFYDHWNRITGWYEKYFNRK